MKRPAVLALALAAAAPLSAQGPAPFVVAETGRGFASLQQAVDAIGAGTGTILVAAGTHRDCAVQAGGHVAYVARVSGQAILEREICEGKAALVLRGRAARVEGLVFQMLRVRDGNGAGIRIEEGDLEVSDSLFRDSDGGILSADDPGGTVRIARSTFSGLGRCDRDLSCAHSVYLGGYGALEIDRARFERGAGGHYVKTRAPRVAITDSSFDDSAGRATNYMIDLSEGAAGEISGNLFVQGANKDNFTALVMVAPEERSNPSDGLVIAGNRAELAPRALPTVFVADRSGDALTIGENRLAYGIRRFQRR